MTNQNYIGYEKAVELANSGLFQTMTPAQIVQFQFFTAELCMPFSTFHEAVGKVLERPVFTHEFAFWEEMSIELTAKGITRDGYKTIEDQLNRGLDELRAEGHEQT